jgi:2-iminobutanoate/2-iminopropanoate deaminase
MENIKAILVDRGLAFSNVVKTSIFLSSMENFPTFNETYSTFLSQPYPVRSTVEVSQLPKNALIEIDVIAVTKD